MKKIINVILVIFVIFLFSDNVNAVLLPLRNINLTVNGMKENNKVSILIPEKLLEYNLNQYIEESKKEYPSYEINDEEYKILEEIKNTSNYIKYVQYMSNKGYFNEQNQIVIRSYCICMNGMNLIGEFEYENQKYIEIEIALNEDNKFTLEMQDYLLSYDDPDIKFKIYDNNDKYEIISLDNHKYSKNNDNKYQEIDELNITYDVNNKKLDNEQNDNLLIKNTKYIVVALLFFITIIICICILKKKK